MSLLCHNGKAQGKSLIIIMAPLHLEEGQFCVVLTFLITLNIHTRCGPLVTMKMMISAKSSVIG